MIQKVQEHKISDYEQLLDIEDAAKPEYSVGDEKCLDELAALLTKSDVHKFVGISLLHKHFEVRDGEIMVQDHSLAGDKIEVKPRSRESMTNAELQPVSIRFDRRNQSFDLIGLEYMDSNVLVDYEQRVPQHVIEEVWNILERHKKIDRFGIRFLAGLNLDEQSAYLEFTDEVERNSVCHLVPRTDKRLDQTIETLWIWRKTPEGTSKMDCVFCCYSSQDGHTKWC